MLLKRKMHFVILHL